jgi:hypothetical protein
MAHAAELGPLLGVLFKRAPAKADAVAANKNDSRKGMMSVGLKIHLIGNDQPFEELIGKLGGYSVLERNVYRHAQAVSCVVLPPVGNTQAAIDLVHCLEQYTRYRLFGNAKVQIQVCSPGRLDAYRSAILGAGFYLGSATIRRYTVDDFETTVSEGGQYNRGRKIVIYDAGGFVPHFSWWARKNGNLKVERKLPFKPGRTDVLVRACRESDIENINLLASLLIYAQEKGYWADMGWQLQRDIDALLKTHYLHGVLEASWVTEDGRGNQHDATFALALTELVAYACDETSRIKKLARLLQGRPSTDAKGILVGMQQIMKKFRDAVKSHGECFKQGDGRT